MDCSYHNTKATKHKLLHAKVLITAPPDKVTKQKASHHTQNQGVKRRENPGTPYTLSHHSTCSAKHTLTQLTQQNRRTTLQLTGN